MIARDGRTVWFHDEATFVPSLPGGHGMWYGVMVDISKQRSTEAELASALEAERKAIEDLRRADEMKDAFLSALSHDLRGPLASILGTVHSLERDELELSEDERRELTAAAARNARRLENVLDDLLDLDRLTRADLSPRRKSVDVAQVIGDVARSVDLGERMLDMDVHPTPLRADPAMVARIVENLLTNEVRHTPQGTRVWIRVAPTPDGALLTVEDDGPGLSPVVRAVASQAFGGHLDRDAQGVGLGLWIVAKFAELHGGRAWYEDRPGGGASFHVLLCDEPGGATD